MTIEVKQMIIKSTVTNERSSEKRSERETIDIEQLRKQLLAECREMIAENIQEQRDR